MKKILGCLLALTMALSAGISALASNDKVEISFCVGDETLTINGTPVTVEKPYVVGEGVTLVPVRVITEAFEAKVDWISETKTVKLSYPDVDISIQIDNPIAEVNGRAETLLAPPQLTSNGYTMVPLRFISENFGAVVSYDEETKRITVTKEKNADSGVSIEGAVNSKYIGDSYFKWSMENPLDMTMEERGFDGMETIFSDGENEISIEIFTYDKETYDFESDYNETKMLAYGLTLVKTEKDTSDKNCMSFHLGVKDKNYYYDYQQFVTPEYIYIVSGAFSNEDTKNRDQYLSLLETFECKFEGADIYDLSNIKDGFKEFKSENLKLSFNVPENFYMASSSESENMFSFYEIEKEISTITAVVYSKSDVKSAIDLAKEDFNHNKEVLNEELAKFSEDLTKKQYGDISATEYTYKVESETQSYFTRDVFFEIGDYVYNMSVTVELPCDDYDVYIDKIINSIKAEPLNSEDVGVFMKNVPVSTGFVKAKLGKSTMELPNIYVKLAEDESSISYVGSVNGAFVYCAKVQDSSATTSDLKEQFKDIEKGFKEEGATIINPVYEKTINNQKYQCLKVKVTQDDETAYVEQYACIYKGSIYLFSVTCSDLLYSKSTQEEIKNIIESIKFE